MKLSNWLASVIRTTVPIVVGSVAGWLAAKIGIVIDEQSQAGFVSGFTGVLIAGYYNLIRWAEGRWPWVGWFLGLAVNPTYNK